jgi:hypothetical protein
MRYIQNQKGFLLYFDRPENEKSFCMVVNDSSQLISSSGAIGRWEELGRVGGVGSFLTERRIGSDPRCSHSVFKLPTQQLNLKNWGSVLPGCVCVCVCVKRKKVCEQK